VALLGAAILARAAVTTAAAERVVAAAALAEMAEVAMVVVGAAAVRVVGAAAKAPQVVKWGALVAAVRAEASKGAVSRAVACLEAETKVILVAEAAAMVAELPVVVGREVVTVGLRAAGGVCVARGVGAVGWAAVAEMVGWEGEAAAPKVAQAAVWVAAATLARHMQLCRGA
jgi:hypothetical protein